MRHAVGNFAVRHTAAILFLVAAACAAGGYAALHMPSAVFPQTDFPRVVVIAEDGVQPADQMMATVTRPIEEAVKAVPGARTVRSITGRGTAEVDVFFDWGTDMPRTELAVSAKVADLRGELPTAVHTDVYRMTFSVFPIIGLSLTSPTRPIESVWEQARYDLKPALLRIPGVADVQLVGGRSPEYRVSVDPARLASAHVSAGEVADAIRRNGQVIPGGLHEEGHQLFLATVDGRLRDADDVRNLTVPTAHGVVRIGDVATVTRGPETVYNRVTADGRDAVLLNVFSQPDASTLEIATQLRAVLKAHKLPGDITVGTFYDQSLLVRDSVRGVWEAIAFGLLLSVVILYLFLKNWGTVLVATVAIPVSVLATIAVMKVSGLSFNLMTLGGVAAAIGLVIDDAIVVVESIYAHRATGLDRAAAVRAGLAEVIEPLLGSTVTPVVVFLPLAFLSGIAGVFFRALAITMTVSLLTSLIVAVTLTPTLAARLIGGGSIAALADPEDARIGGLAMRSVIVVYEHVIRWSLRNRWFTAGVCGLVLAGAVIGYGKLKTDFLPTMDEGGFVIDYIAPAGISMDELDRQMRQVEGLLRATPEVQSYSRRTGTALGVALVEPNTGDFLVRLRRDRKRTTETVISDLRKRIDMAQPRTKWAFPGILVDLVGDLTWEDEPVEVKVFGTDQQQLETFATRAVKDLNLVPGIVDPNDGLTYTGSSVRFKVRPADAQRLGLSTESVGAALSTAMTGEVAGSVLEGDRPVNIRVRADAATVATTDALTQLPIRTPGGQLVHLSQVADVTRTPGELELHRDDQRQDVAVLAELEGRDLGSGMADVRAKLDADPQLAGAHVEYGGLYEQQQQAFANLVVVLAVAIVLVFAVAVLEFRSFRAPLAIVTGAVLSAFGIVIAVMATGTTLNIVTFLGALIGMGIVHKNGILVIDHVEQLRAAGVDLTEAVVTSGRRRLRPVLMTSLAAAAGMLPLAVGVGTGTDLLRPLGVAVIGAVTASVLLSLVATPTAYHLLMAGRRDRDPTDRQPPAGFDVVTADEPC
jgi:CzcA family heavy metal efflux pump